MSLKQHSTADFLRELGDRGIYIYLKGDALKLKAAPGQVTPEILEMLKNSKAELIDFLKNHRRQTFELSYAQERLWFLDRYEKESTAYHMPGLLHFQGTLSSLILEKCFQTIVERHDILRTNFIEKENCVIQHVHETQRFDLAIRDLLLVDGEDPETVIQAKLEKELGKMFTLDHGLLFQATLFRVNPQDHWLFVNMHHIISDGWSVSLLLQELTALYEAYLHGRPDPLAPLTLQYSDYAEWQRKHLRGETLEKKLAYWKEQLAGLPVLELPTTYPRPVQQSYRGDLVTFEIDPDLTLALKQFSQQHGVTLVMTLVSAFGILMYRYSQQDDLAIGTLTANRNRSELESLIGLFVNTLVLRQNLSGNPEFLTFLQQVKHTMTEAQNHQDVPFEKVVHALNLPRDTSHSPLVQVGFVLQNTPTTEVHLPGLQAEVKDFNNHTAKFDLTLNLTPEIQGMSGSIEYCVDLFSQGFVESMVSHFERLLESILVYPQQRIDAFNMLGLGEKQKLLTGLNFTQANYPKDQTFAALFETQAANTPDTPAVVFEGQTLSYQALNEKANQLAHYLINQGVTADSLVAICVERSLEMMIGLLGILKAGGAYVPIDPEHPSERITYMLNDSQTQLLLTQDTLKKHCPSEGVTAIDLDQLENLVANSPKTNPVTATQANHLAYVIYTSGSTGTPKGVMLEHCNLINFLWSMKDRPGITNHDTLLAVTSISFDIHTLELYLPLLCGAKVVVASSEQCKTPQALAKLIEVNAITIMQATPATWKMLLADGWQPASPLKILCGGEALPEALKNELLSHPNLQLWNMYGPTETAVWSATAPLTASETVHIGEPIANTKLYILRPHLKLVPQGIPGELYIGGDGVARGYLNRPELTNERFLPHPFSKNPNKRIYKTGDLVRLSENGHIEFMDRLDNQIKIQGFRIEPGEIEYQLHLQNGIRESVVLAKNDPQGHKILVAFLVCAKPLEVQTIRNTLRDHLPEYMIPSAIVFLEALPLTPNGKIDKKALARQDVLQQSTQAFVAPRNAVEMTVASIFAQVLQLPESEEKGMGSIGVHDNFFELGGHSLLATQIVSQIRHEFAQELPLKTLFTHPTVAEVSAILTSEEARYSLTPIPRAMRDDLPLSFGQERLWFIEHYQQQGTTYHMPGLLHLKGTLSPQVVEQCFQTMVDRHDILRTRYVHQEGVPYQQVEASASFQLQQQSLTSTSTLDETLKTAIDEALAIPFQLESDLLLRATLYRVDEQNHYLLVDMHHIITDAWSMRVMINEFVALYRAYNQRQNNPLKPLEIQYGDYAVWQKECLDSNVWSADLAFWKETLKDVAVLELPTTYPRPAEQSTQGAQILVNIDADLTQALERMCQQQGVTLFMGLLSAYGVFLQRYSQQDDIAIGSAIANRHRVELEPLIGFFVNNVVLRLNLSENPSFADLLQQTKQITLDAYEHQDMPFEKLVDALGVERNPSYSPLFQVGFGLDNTLPAQFELPDLEVEVHPLKSQTAKYDLTMNLEQQNGHLIGTLEYCTDLFDETTVEAMLHHFEQLLRSVVAHPEAKLSELELLPPREKHHLLHGLNQTTTEYPKTQSIPTLFEAQVAQAPNAVAVVSDERSLTYEQLNQQANQLAHHLIQTGVTPGTLVAICAERSLEMVIGFLGILKAGGAYVPIDPSYPEQRQVDMLKDAQAPVLLTLEKLVATLPEHQAKVVCLDRIASDLVDLPQTNPTLAISASELAYVIYTSGSTGKPKGVAVSHRAVNRLVFNTNYISLNPTDRMAQASNASFDAATFEIWGALLHGARLFVIPQETIMSPSKFAEYLATHQISTMFLTTALVNQVARDVPDAFQHLRVLLFGGEAVEPRWIRQILQVGPPQQLLHVYGPTESTTFATWFLIESVAEDAHTIPIGSPLANTTFYVLDPHLNPTPLGVPGELYIGGDGLAEGYFHRPELTEAKFIDHPFVAPSKDDPRPRLYRTGDIVRHTPGYASLTEFTEAQTATGTRPIEYLNRIDNQVKIRGFRIELSEIEHQLLAIETIRECAVLVKQDEPEQKTLVAYLVGNQATLDTQAIKATLEVHLPDYMIPSAMVPLETLPLNANGKIDKHALLAMDTTPQSNETFVAPRNEIETKLAAIFTKVLRKGSAGKELPEVGIHDNFFELGGDSILSIQIVSRAKKQGLKFKAKDLFDHQTIAKLAQVLQGKAAPKTAKPAKTITPKASQLESVATQSSTLQGEVPLNPIQTWFFEENFKEPQHWNQSVLLHCPKSVSSTTLEKALNTIVAQHDAFRLRFETVSGKVQPSYGPLLSQTLETIDLSHIESAEALPSAIEEACTKLHTQLSINQGPIFKMALMMMPEYEANHRLFLVAHHLVIDGVSWRIVLEDLKKAIDTLQPQQTVDLGEKSSSLQSYMTCLTRYAQSEKLQNELSYWQAAVACEPTQWPSVPNEKKPTVATNQSWDIVLDETQTRHLLQSVHRAYQTQINDILLAALGIGLQAWTKQTHFPIDLEGHGREEIDPELDLTRTVGWFTSMFPIQLQIPDHADVGTVIKTTKELLRNLPQQGIGYGILRYLHSDATVRESLIPRHKAQISFNYLGQFDNVLDDADRLCLASESTGLSIAPVNHGPHGLDIIASVSNQKLQVSFEFSTEFQTQSSVMALADAFQAALQQIIEHCLRPDSQGYTPSDFPLAKVTQAGLNRVVGQLAHIDQLESLYALSPLQEGMLFHHLHDPHNDDYVEQLHCEFLNAIDVQAFERAWEWVCRKHSVFRTAILYEGLEHPLQRVAQQIQMPLECIDLGDLPEAQRQEKFNTLCQSERELGFDLTKAPLMRVKLVKLEEQRYGFIWTLHHIMMDGWSLPVVFQELFDRYAGLLRGESLLDAVPDRYEQFIAYLQQQDTQSNQTFWQTYLHGVQSPTPLPLGRMAVSDVNSAPYSVTELLISPEVSAQLDDFAKTHHLTINTLVQGAWAVLLQRYGQVNDVVFGATVSGRPPELDGVEQRVGLFINTLPIRATFRSEASTLSWLQQHQATQPQLQEHQHSALTDIHQWCDVPNDTALFESLVVFENYPIGDLADQDDHPLQVQNLDFVEHTNYPLTLVAGMGKQLSLKLSYNEALYTPAMIAQLSEHLKGILQNFLEHPI